MPRPPLREVCAEVPPCPSWVAAFAAQRTTLRVHVIDRVSPVGCVPGASVKVGIWLDAAPIGELELPCLDAPASRYHVEGPVITPGLHELAVRARLENGEIESSTLVSLPAFDLVGEGRAAILGSEIVVDVTPNDVLIGPPQVYPPR